jgi:ATP synthase protein I
MADPEPRTNAADDKRRVNWDDDDRWKDGWRDDPVRPLSRDEARALMAREPCVSPWEVVAVQCVVGIIVALIVWGATGREEGLWSALYGAAVVVVPGALMARGMTSKLASMNPGVGAVSYMLWQGVKIAVSVIMLMAAPRIVDELSWPALLAGLVVCIKVYWVALLWRRPAKS